MSTGLTVVPLARFLGQATEQISARAGAGLGAFLNASFAAVALSVLTAGFVSFDGESNWMEGVLLLAVYFILALAFYFLPMS